MHGSRLRAGLDGVHRGHRVGAELGVVNTKLLLDQDNPDHHRLAPYALRHLGGFGRAQVGDAGLQPDLFAERSVDLETCWRDVLMLRPSASSIT